MANKQVGRRRAFLLFEIGLVGLLAWMVLTSDSNAWLKNEVHAGGQDKKAKKAKKQKRTPTDVLAGDGALELMALGGTTCQVIADFESGDQGFTVVPVFGTPMELWHRVDNLCRTKM